MIFLLKKYNHREDGFTLVELLIVVLIIGVLAAIAIPVYLGVQNQAHKNAVKADVNNTVKRVQVALVEGVSSATIKANNAPYIQQSESGTIVDIVDSPSKPFTNEFSVEGFRSSADYSYIYDSVTGKFAEGNGSGIVAGGGTVNTAPVITSAAALPVATAGSTYPGFTVTATGTAPLTFTATGLPAGMSIDSASGVISGTPSAAGDFTPTITVSGTGTPATQNATIHVNANPGTVTILTSSLGSGTNGQSYSATITSSTTGTAGTVAYTVTTGSLPAGLTLTSGGVLSGTPTAAGSTTFTVTATKTTAEGAKATGTKQYTVLINAGPAYSETFESYNIGDNAGWTTVSGTHSFYVTTADAYSGTKSMRMDTSSGGRIQQGSNLTGLTVGQAYTLTVAVKNYGGINIMNGGSARLGANSGSAAWNIVTINFTYQAGDRVGFYNSSGTAYFDAISIQ